MELNGIKGDETQEQEALWPNVLTSNFTFNSTHFLQITSGVTPLLHTRCHPFFLKHDLSSSLIARDPNPMCHPPSTMIGHLFPIMSSPPVPTFHQLSYRMSTMLTILPSLDTFCFAIFQLNDIFCSATFWFTTSSPLRPTAPSHETFPVEDTELPVFHLAAHHPEVRIFFPQEVTFHLYYFQLNALSSVFMKWSPHHWSKQD